MANSEIWNSGVVIAAIGVVGATLARRGKSQHEEQNDKLDSLINGHRELLNGHRQLLDADNSHDKKLNKIGKELKDHGRRINAIEENQTRKGDKDNAGNQLRRS